MLTISHGFKKFIRANPCQSGAKKLVAKINGRIRQNSRQSINRLQINPFLSAVQARSDGANEHRIDACPSQKRSIRPKRLAAVLGSVT